MAIKRWRSGHSKIALCGRTRLGTIKTGHRVTALGRQGRAFMKKNMKYVAIAFVIFYLLSSPNEAAGFVNNVFTQLGRAGGSVSAFVDGLDLSP
ncbi:hypothetical protein [Actinomadura sp. WMMB 499]|uniref:hypothetical protein n=1 Tax=Actinomadura sp. WMMB 499 TaxID=1219491 RepID=UPI00124747E4|nr:hypothetical protein [Actinomadura sp. WMMB 499]QFG20630.1 hypothetical protein F7P10_05165 [Actinomadura sp. WMMB 499]